MTTRSRAHRRWTQGAAALAASLLLVGSMTTSALNASAQVGVVIQPGVQIQTEDGGLCTLNWIYDGTDDLAGKVHAGTAGHCVENIGEPVMLTDGSSASNPVLEIGSVAYIDNNLDYAFIEINPENYGFVDPSMKGHPQIPTGVSTSQTAHQGDVVQYSGYGVGFDSTEATQEQRVGVLCFNDGKQHYSYGPGSPGDSGGPVANRTDGNKALGIFNTGGFAASLPDWACVGEGGVSVEGMLTDAADAGFTVELRTVGTGMPSQVTGVDNVSASVDGDLVAISGQATFVDVPGEVGMDPSGDAVVSQGVVPFGDDLVSAAIGRPEPFGDGVVFTLGVANQPQELNGILEALRYHWDIVTASGPLTLRAIRTDLSAQAVSAVFQILRGSTVVAEIDGRMADGVVEWTVPMGQIGAQPGDLIRPGERVASLIGVSASGTAVNLFDTGDSIVVEDYLVPEPSVRFGIGSSGTPPQQIPLTEIGVVESDGSFSGSLPAPPDPGTYTVVITACYSSTKCGSESRAIQR